MSSRPPTGEQIDCVEKFATGQRLRVNAFAGTGKTTTAIMLARSAPHRFGQFMSFNRAIADDAARKFPSTVSCKTTHQLAFRALVRTFGNPKMNGRVNGGYLATKLGLRGCVYGGAFILPRSWGFLLSETVARYCRSGSQEFQPWHVPVEGSLKKLKPADIQKLRQDVVAEAKKVWVSMIDPRSDIPLGHDGYLKLWALSRPQIPCDYLILDEAQDTNAVVMALVEHQHAQIVALGDRNQQIFEWRGALNAMTKLPADVEGRLSKSFRFGPVIAENATKIIELLGETVPLLGFEERDSSIGPIANPRAILFRTNAAMIEQLMAELARGRRPFLVKGTSEILSYVTAAESLMAGRPVDRPLEFFGFENWDDVKAVLQFEEAKDLRRWVDLIEKYSTEGLRKAMESLPKDAQFADVILSTAHGAKGLEWPTVRLADDFLLGVRTDTEAEKGEIRRGPPKDLFEASARVEVKDADGKEEELRLFYVAATRAMERLEIHPELNEKMRRLAAMRGRTFEAPVGSPEDVAA